MIRIDDRLYDESYFSETSARLAAEIGLSDRDTGRYAVCFPETVDWLALFFAIRKAGASVLPIHPGTPYPGARKLAIGAGCDRLLYNSLTAEVLQKPELGSPQGTLLQMSSGTTGAPKCVARSWAEVDAEIESYVRTFRQPEGMTPVIACPTTHSYGLICGILVALKRGQTPVIVNTGNPKYLLKVLRETERPLLYSSPAILHTLARLLPRANRSTRR
ncbi:AMP-binding protein [Ensifer sp. ENS12]|uniref:AMP-binding protein n=1 Tax=Ensifer sp. ENS12 TaxID=2854774 RepID=UPI002814D4BD|nr:AMP-binding protein [Ensifer sp. ENS12]